VPYDKEDLYLPVLLTNTKGELLLQMYYRIFPMACHHVGSSGNDRREIHTTNLLKISDTFFPVSIAEEMRLFAKTSGSTSNASVSTQVIRPFAMAFTFDEMFGGKKA